MKKINTLATALSLLTLTGCGDTTTDADYPAGIAPIDENTPAASEDPPAADLGEQTPDSPNTRNAEGLVYTVPGGWTIDGPRQMRALTLDAGDGVEVAVAKWPGDVGGYDCNLTRWLGQAGYNPADTATMAALGEFFATVTVGDAEAKWIPLLDGDGGTPMIALWVPRDGETWTIKITGDAEALRGKQDALRAWAESLSFE